MERTLIRDAKEKIGEVIFLKGFVQTVRNQKAVQFLILRDHTGVIQIVAERSDDNKDTNEAIATLTRESAVEITGVVVSNPSVKLGQLEVQLKTLHVLIRFVMQACPSISSAKRKRISINAWIGAFWICVNQRIS